jgi:arylsulfatase A-like enzyme
VAAGRVVEAPAALWDLLPTFLELAGVAAPAGLDGRSLVPLLTGGGGGGGSGGGGDDQSPHDAASPLYWETFTRFRGQAVRVGRYKALRTALSGSGDPVRLFDLSIDPAERFDLSGRPDLCPTYLELVDLLNRSRTDPGGALSFPPLTEQCPPTDPPPVLAFPPVVLF